MTTAIYVALAGMHRGGGPRIGSTRWDVCVMASDGSQESYENALKEATARYLAAFPEEHAVHHFGTWSTAQL